MRALVFILFAACAQSDSGEPAGACATGEHCGMEGAQCQIEGHAACNAEPVSGGCTCHAGRWECFTSCPAECPMQRPTAEAACTLPAATSCPYEDPPYSANRVICTCTNGRFACS